MIPQVSVMDWDPILAQWDAGLHGGQPWQMLQPLLGTPAVTLGLYHIYAAWFLVFPGVLVWQALTNRPGREQFLVSTVLCWGLVGTLGALAFASVGPVFYGRLWGSPDPFAGLYAYVHTAGLALPQDLLWDAFERKDLAAFGKGISAMPSLHVAISTLNALVAWRTHRWLGAALGVYAALVALASVHLGWHYAIDAYAGAAVATVIWFAVGWALSLMGRAGVRSVEPEMVQSR